MLHLTCPSPLAAFSWQSDSTYVSLLDESLEVQNLIGSFDGEAILLVSLNGFQFPEYGSYALCLLVSNPCATDSICQQVFLVPSRLDEGEQAMFGLFPNPVSIGESLHIQMGSQRAIQLQIIDASGRTVIDVQDPSSLRQESLLTRDISTLVPGHYSLLLSTPDQELHSRSFTCK